MTFSDFVRNQLKLLEEGRSIPTGEAPPVFRPPPEPDAPLAMMFAPHPDDECITGLLPLRLQREAGWRIANVPVTHGSNPARQAARHRELARACTWLGWDLLPSPAPAGNHPHPPCGLDDVCGLLATHRPRAIFFPHARDWNSRHTATHGLLMEALGRMPVDFVCEVLETEFWGAMDDPNLMVEGGVEEVADLVSATAFHEGEVARNPYHLLLPAWMMDNVRRGAERIAGQGRSAPAFAFATLYRHSQWGNGRLKAASPRFLPMKFPGKLL